MVFFSTFEHSFLTILHINLKRMRLKSLIIKTFIVFVFALTAGFSKAQILEPVKWSFDTKIISNTEAELLFTAKIDKTWHLYSQHLPEDGPVPTTFVFEKSKNYKLIGKVVEPKGIKEYDPNFEMEVTYFANKAVFRQKIEMLTNIPFEVKGELEFMCCDDSRCLPPNGIDFSFKLPGAKGEIQALAEENPQADDENLDTVAVIAETAPSETEIDVSNVPIENKADSNSLWGFFILAFVFGLLAILTPCVFPMIPMTVTFFMKAGKKGKYQAMLYGIAIIVIYVVFGSVLAVFFGEGFGNWISTHWIPNVLFFIIFIFFAAVFFGFFELQMPSWLINKSVANEDRGDFIGPIFMALTLVLVSFSCTGPIVGTIVVASAGGEIIKPIIGMLGFSLAFALPFTLFALFPGWLQKLPKSGGWLNSVKVFLGFIELAFALKFLNIPDQTYQWGILDREVYLSMWIVIFVLLGMYLLGKIRFPLDSESTHIKSFPRLLIAIASFSFAVYMVPGLWGAPLKALAGWLPPMGTQDFDINAIARNNAGGGGGNTTYELCDTPKYSEKFKPLPHGLKGYYELEQAYECSKKLNKPIFIDFTGHGCTNCREMESNVWSDPRVLDILRNEYIIVALYVDDKVVKLPEEEWYTNKRGKLIKSLGAKNADIMISQFSTNAQPYYVIVDENATVLTSPQAYDLDILKFIDFLENGLKSYKKSKENS